METRVNILAVDDQADSLTAIEATLERLGQRVFTARSGRDALEWCRRENFAVILLDVQLPDMDGFEVAAGIRRLPRSSRTPVLFLTGQFQDASDVFRGYRAGAVDYMVKPFSPDILRSKVSIFIELARGAAMLEEVERRLQAREAEALGGERRRLLLAALSEIEDLCSELSRVGAGRPKADGEDGLSRLREAARRASRLVDPKAPTYGDGARTEATP